MKRVVLIRSNPVSPDPPVEKVALALTKAGYAVTVIGWDRDADYDQKQDALELSGHRVEMIRFGIKAQFGGGIKKNLVPLFLFQKRLRRWLIDHKADYDMIHAFDFDTGLVAARYAAKYKKKFVYHILDYYADSHSRRDKGLGKLIARLENAVINSADATLLCTEQRQEQIAGSSPKRLEFIHNTPAAEQIGAVDFALEAGDKVKLAYVGILQDHRLLKETAEAVAQSEHLELHIGGFGKYDSYFEELSENHENIHFYGKLSYHQTLSLEQQCDIMLAVYEPNRINHRLAAPNKFYESLMLGKPVIMARGTGMSHVIEEHGTGVLIEYSKEGFLEGVNKLIGMRDQWPAIRERMQALYRDQYSWSIMEKRLVQMYAELQNEKDSDRQ